MDAAAQARVRPAQAQGRVQVGEGLCAPSLLAEDVGPLAEDLRAQRPVLPGQLQGLGEGGQGLAAPPLTLEGQAQEVMRVSGPVVEPDGLPGLLGRGAGPALFQEDVGALEADPPAQLPVAGGRAQGLGERGQRLLEAPGVLAGQAQEEVGVPGPLARRGRLAELRDRGPVLLLGEEDVALLAADPRAQPPVAAAQSQGPVQLRQSLVEPARAPVGRGQGQGGRPGLRPQSGRRLGFREGQVGPALLEEYVGPLAADLGAQARVAPGQLQGLSERGQRLGVALLAFQGQAQKEVGVPGPRVEPDRLAGLLRGGAGLPPFQQGVGLVEVRLPEPPGAGVGTRRHALADLDDQFDLFGVVDALEARHHGGDAEAQEVLDEALHRYGLDVHVQADGVDLLLTVAAFGHNSSFSMRRTIFRASPERKRGWG